MIDIYYGHGILLELKAYATVQSVSLVIQANSAVMQSTEIEWDRKHKEKNIMAMMLMLDLSYIEIKFKAYPLT